MINESAFIADQAMIDHVVALRARFGGSAGLEAAIRAEQSRERGNVVHFCRWRTVERVLGLLDVDEASGTLH